MLEEVGQNPKNLACAAHMNNGGAARVGPGGDRLARTRPEAVEDLVNLHDRGGQVSLLALPGLIRAWGNDHTNQ